MRTTKLAVVALAAVLGTCVSSTAQSPFEAVPKASASRYRFDLARTLFATPEAEVADRAAFAASLARVDAAVAEAGHSGASGAALLRLFDAFQEADLSFRRHQLYLTLRFATDTTNTAADEDEGKLRGDMRARRASLRRTLVALDDGAFESMARSTPALERYRYAVAEARRYRPHTLSADAEGVLARLSGLVDTSSYGSVVSGIDFGTVKTPRGELDVLRQQGEISHDSDRRVRAEGAERLDAGYASRRDLLAYTLLRNAGALDELARARGFADFREQALFDAHLDPAFVDRLYARIAAAAELNRRYERATLARVSRAVGVPESELRGSDLDAPEPDAATPRLTIDEATAAIRAALAPLGDEYGRELARAPRSRERADRRRPRPEPRARRVRERLPDRHVDLLQRGLRGLLHRRRRARPRVRPRRAGAAHESQPRPAHVRRRPRLFHRIVRRVQRAPLHRIPLRARRDRARARLLPRPLRRAALRGLPERGRVRGRVGDAQGRVEGRRAFGGRPRPNRRGDGEEVLALLRAVPRLQARLALRRHLLRRADAPRRQPARRAARAPLLRALRTRSEGVPAEVPRPASQRLRRRAHRAPRALPRTPPRRSRLRRARDERGRRAPRRYRALGWSA